jgi:hypothetical protein
MTQPISSAYTDRTRDPYQPDSGPPTLPATRVAVAQTIPELPDTDGALVANAVKAATAGAPHMLLAHGVRAEDVDNPVATPMQQRMDAFKESATPTFHTPQGDATVAIPFHMNTGGNPYQQELTDLGAKVGLSPRQANLVANGRGTPQEIQRMTQALIDARKLPPGSPSDLTNRIRTMMCNYGVGLDCAGYVQQAFLASRGISRSQTGLAEVDKEDLTGLAGKGFKRVPQSQIREGDLLVLGPPPSSRTGHTLIVRASRLATPEEALDLERKAAPGWQNAAPSQLRRLELDSSWGNGGRAEAGGVQRQIFWHDEANGSWMRQTSSGGSWRVEPPNSIYFGHPIDGVYRPRQEP